ncbi:MAG: hypothetical protein AAGU15_09005 [Anaerolineaceae bacterium]|jgi:hypothetical protein
MVLPPDEMLSLILSKIKGLERSIEAIRDQVDRIREEMEFDEYAGETDDDD